MKQLSDPADREAVVRLDTWAFPPFVSADDLLPLAQSIPPGRTWGVTRAALAAAEGVPAPSLQPGAPDSEELVAMYGAYPLGRFPVPGTQVSCGWLTWVGVHPGYRRRGIMREFIAHHFADCAARGEAISGLNAAEAAIYGRFGYGKASNEVSVTIPRGATLRQVTGSERLSVEITEWNDERHGDAIAALHAEYASVPAGLGRPGWATWESPELREMQHRDPAALRSGEESLRVVIVRDAAGKPRGYARFRRKPDWQRHRAVGAVNVKDIVALDAAAAHRLWQTLLDLDLTEKVTAGPLTVDDPILTLLDDPRVALPELCDLQWIRIVDLERALAERSYAADVDVVLDVTDALIPANAGRWRVQAAAFGAATVTRTDAPADLTLDVRELGAAHLGSTSLAALAQAGLIAVRDPESLARAAAAWSWPIAAGANWVF